MPSPLHLARFQVGQIVNYYLDLASELPAPKITRAQAIKYYARTSFSRFAWLCCKTVGTVFKVGQLNKGYILPFRRILLTGRGRILVLISATNGMPFYITEDAPFWKMLLQSHARAFKTYIIIDKHDPIFQILST